MLNLIYVPIKTDTIVIISFISTTICYSVSLDVTLKMMSIWTVDSFASAPGCQIIEGDW